MCWPIWPTCWPPAGRWSVVTEGYLRSDQHGRHMELRQQYAGRLACATRGQTHTVRRANLVSNSTEQSRYRVRRSSSTRYRPASGLPVEIAVGHRCASGFAEFDFACSWRAGQERLGRMQNSDNKARLDKLMQPVSRAIIMGLSFGLTIVILADILLDNVNEVSRSFDDWLFWLGFILWTLTGIAWIILKATRNWCGGSLKMTSIGGSLTVIFFALGDFLPTFGAWQSIGNWLSLLAFVILLLTGVAWVVVKARKRSSKGSHQTVARLLQRTRALGLYAGSVLFVLAGLLSALDIGQPVSNWLTLLGYLILLMVGAVWIVSITTKGWRSKAQDSAHIKYRLTFALILVITVTVIVGMASQGSDFSYLLNLGGKGKGLGPLLTGSLQSLLIISVPVLLVTLPNSLRNHLAWQSSSELAQKSIPSLLAAGATVTTGIFVVTLSFNAGPLANLNPGQVTIAALGVVVVLVPFYRWTAKVCWEPGIAALIDPQRWRSNWAQVLSELKRGDQAAEVETTEQDGRPETKELAAERQRPPELRAAAEENGGATIPPELPSSL
jgi:cytochrome bd-type quinol oxidase subunit 2